MVNKRPFHDEGIYEVGCKNPRHQTDSDPYLCDGIARCDSPQNLASDEGEISTRKYCDEEKTTKDMSSEDPNEAKEELQKYASSSNGNANDEYANPEPAFHVSFFPDLFELGHQETSLAQHRDIYSFLLEHPPQKTVPVGPENQAIVPEWKIRGTSKSSGSCLIDDDDNEEKLLGTCLIPMPDMESFGYCDRGTRKVCSCLDGGSLSCVRLHVTEARDELREELGPEFGRLGLCDMGEEVARRWSKAEEQSFHDAVYSNPASSGKNFWHVLTAVFPTRTKQELVNYYFNVFMLRKRAGQNRFDPENVDSDNDEWHVSELGMSDQEDDSVAESFDRNAPAHNQENHEGELTEGHKMEGEPVNSERLDFTTFYDHSVVESFDQFGLPRDHGFHGWEDEIELEGQKDVLKGGLGLLDGNNLVGDEDKGVIDDISPNVADSGTNVLCQVPGKISTIDHDAGDDSCMSYENQISKLDSCGPVDSRVDGRESS